MTDGESGPGGRRLAARRPLGYSQAVRMRPNGRFSLWGDDMRQPALILLLSSALALPAAGLAQRNPAPSSSAPTVDDYVCTFSGDCGQNAAGDDQNPNGPRPRISATRRFALSGAEHGAAPVHRVGPPALHRTARNLAASSSSASSAAAAAPPPAA